MVGRLREAEACFGGNHYLFGCEVSATVCCKVPSIVHPLPYVEGVRKMSGKIQSGDVPRVRVSSIVIFMGLNKGMEG
jgi:hypothetical protein